jgi:hypothetical protein
MFYIRLSDNAYMLTESQVREAFPNVSFPSELAAPGYARIFFMPAPDHNRETHHVLEKTPVLVSGRYEQQWEVLPLDAETITAQAAAAKQAANDEIKANLAANCLAIIDALCCNDTAAIAAHSTAQATLRAGLR